MAELPTRRGDEPLSTDEAKAIKALEMLACRWPSSLMLFSAVGTYGQEWLE